MDEEDQAIPTGDDQSQSQQPFNIVGSIGSGLSSAGQTVANADAAQPDPTGAIPESDEEQGQQPFNIISAVGSGVRNAGQAVANANAAQPEPTGGAVPQNNPKKIASLLLGDGAAPPDQAQAMADEFKKQGANDDQANLLAVLQGGKTGGPQAEWAMVQYNRRAFNAKQAFANAALQGTDGKAPDINAATRAATQAGAHVLDGTTAVFHPQNVVGPGAAAGALPGVDVLLTDADGNKTQYAMSQQQFGEYLNLAKTSQWDRLMQTGGIAGAMQQIGAIKQNPNAAPGKGDPNFPGTTTVGKGQQQGGDQADDTSTAPRDVADVVGKDQSRFQMGGENAKGNTPAADEAIKSDRAAADAKAKQQASDDADYQRMQDQIEGEAAKRFPWASQTGQRNAWIAQRRSEIEKNNATVDAAAEKGKNAVERSRIAAGAKTASTQMVVEQRAAAAQQKHDYAMADLTRKAGNTGTTHEDAVMREKGRLARAELAANPSADAEAIYAKYELPVPWAAPAAAPSQGVAPVVRGNPAQKDAPSSAGAQRIRAADGKYYIRGPDGKAQLDPNQD